MEFHLRNGKKVEIIFWREKNGKVKAFPENDLELVRREGTSQTRKFLISLLKGFRSSKSFPKHRYYESF